MKPLLVLGYGNMAQAILAQNPFITAHYELYIAGRDSKKAKDFVSACELSAKILPAHSNHQGQYEIDCNGKDMLLCIKPKGLESFVFKGKARCVYSVLAGVSIKSIQAHIQSTYIVRLMPNIAAHSKLSATAFYYLPNTNKTLSILHKEVIPFIESFGNAVQVDNESLIESSIAPSGSGIAFLALIAESLIDAGVLEGLTYAQSVALVKQCFAGFSAELAHKSPSELKYAISSPGGTTIRGIQALEQSGVRGALINAAHIAAQYAKDSITAHKPLVKDSTSQIHLVSNPFSISNTPKKQEKIRLVDIDKELGQSAGSAFKKAKELGLKVKTPSSSITKEEADWVLSECLISRSPQGLRIVRKNKAQKPKAKS